MIFGVSQSAEQQGIIRQLFATHFFKHVQQVRDIHLGALFTRHIQHHLPLMQHDSALAHIQRLTHGVGHHHGGQLTFGHDAFGQLQYKVGCTGVQRCRVLIQQQMREGCRAAMSRLTAWR